MLLWIIYIALIIIGLFSNKSRLYPLLCIIFFALLSYLNTDAADYRSLYLPTYLNPTIVRDMDPGWVILCRLGSAAGLTYNGFACIVTAISMLLLYSAISKISDSISLLFALFLVYPGPIVLVQLRQFVAMALVAYASTLFTRDGLRFRVLYIALVLLAYTIHRTALVFLSLLFLPKLENVSLWMRILIFIIAVGFVGIVYFKSEDLSSILFGEVKTMAYLYGETHKNTILGGLRNIALSILMIVLSSECLKSIRSDSISNNYCNSVSLENGYHKFGSNIVNAQLLMIVFMPFMLISNDFMRFERYSYLMAILLFVSRNDSISKHSRIVLKMILVLVSLLFAYEFAIKGTFDTVYIPLLSYEYSPAFFV